MINKKINQYPLIDGYYSLGLYKETYPDVEWVSYAETELKDMDFSKLKKEIETALLLKKIVALVLWDEEIIWPPNPELISLLNSYKDDPFWLVTQLDKKSQLIYTFQHAINCKIIELPWTWLNDALCYYEVQQTPEFYNTYSQNYLCMVNRLTEFKLDLVREIKKQQLDSYGLITMSMLMDEFKNNEFIQLSPHLPYQHSETNYHVTAAQIQVSTSSGREKIWISGNVENFLHIEKTYQDIPLVLHSEVTNGIFQSSEKSLWPLLLGKMALIHGRSETIKYMQKFYDFDISQYANLEFDNIDQFDSESHQLRRSKLLQDNVELIKNSREIYQKFKSDLEQARWTIGKNLLDFSRKQIDHMLDSV